MTDPHIDSTSTLRSFMITLWKLGIADLGLYSWSIGSYGDCYKVIKRLEQDENRNKTQ